MKKYSYKKEGKEERREREIVLKLLANANRFGIMEILLSAKRDVCVHELADLLGISQSLTSHQLSYLEARGVVEAVRVERTTCYKPTKSERAIAVGKVLWAITQK